MVPVVLAVAESMVVLHAVVIGPSMSCSVLLVKSVRLMFVVSWSLLVMVMMTLIKVVVTMDEVDELRLSYQLATV